MSSRRPQQAFVEWIASLHPDVPEAAEAISASLQEAPDRISNAYRELLSGYRTERDDLIKVTAHLDPTREYTGLVGAHDIPFVSLCAHHFLPFFGHVRMVYEPGGLILGIGKMPRLVEMRTRRFQIQEFIARDLCDDLMDGAQARGAFVQTSAQHLCVCGRGPNKPGAWNTTTYARGSLSAWRHLPPDSAPGAPGGPR
ncbi:GTP cyclohydrolase I [Micromonospora sp. NPDC000207]|uniref:GTP cyclohydrolase I n=1 Tax=Micromonospora sp. NPDC000207 TaxID=3154246 RepID=UPI00331F691B